MFEKQENIYQTARKYAKLTLIEASVELDISLSRLKAYEYDERPCPDVIALKMAKLYKTPWLRVQHLQKNVVFCDVFGLIPSSNDSAMNVLRAQKEVSEVMDLFPQMVAKTVKKENLGNSLLKECREGMQALLVLVGIEQEEKTPRTTREPLATKI